MKTQTDSEYSMVLDIETLSLRPQAVITEIGVLVFRRKCMTSEACREIYPDLLEQLAAGRHFDAATYAFHVSKGSLPKSLGEMSIKMAVAMLQDLFDLYDPHQVWIQGPDFDRPILEDFLIMAGHRLPWKFWRTRDARTVWDLAFPGEKHPRRNHRALDDCKATLGDLRAALNALGIGPDNCRPEGNR